MNAERIVLIERLAMEIFDSERKEKGLSEAALGQKAYPEAPNPRMKIQALRIKRGHGKPQRLNFGDFWAICEALNREPSEVCAEIKLIKLRQAEQNKSPS
ncbi:MAG: hypothetical protein LBR94_05685 [Desulfovibrio sp.]|jgi:hypothetical protein|nr:hypothetical protein [Desulfovibrio sp.]